MCCSGKCVKNFSYFYIGLFLVLGLSEIFYGAFCLVVTHLTETFDLRLGYSYVTVPPLVLVLSGIILFSLIILGCCGIAKEITCCVHLYSIILLVLAVLQISVGILAIYPTMISTDEKAALKIEIDKHLGKQQRINSTTLDNIQLLFYVVCWRRFWINVLGVILLLIITNEVSSPCLECTSTQQFLMVSFNLLRGIRSHAYDNMRCCGKTFPNDSIPDVNSLLPKSCCGSSDYKCDLNSTSLHQSGCTRELMDFIILHNDIVGLVSVSSGSIEITAGIIGICLGYRLLRDGTTSYAM